MPIIPYRFMFRLKYSCPHVVDMPLDDDDRLVDLPETATIDPFAEIDNAPRFADVRLGWNESGLGLQVEVRGKESPPAGDPDRPRRSDGITLWIDTRGDRSGHRATKSCHQFHFLAAGGGSLRDEPVFLQTKINRALQDAPLASAADVPFRVERTKHGYRLEAFLGAGVLHGWDPEQNPRLGIYYAVHDSELGESTHSRAPAGEAAAPTGQGTSSGDQTPGVGSEFPFADDPSLWATLELVADPAAG